MEDCVKLRKSKHFSDSYLASDCKTAKNHVAMTNSSRCRDVTANFYQAYKKPEILTIETVSTRSSNY